MPLMQDLSWSDCISQVSQLGGSLSATITCTYQGGPQLPRLATWGCWHILPLLRGTAALLACQGTLPIRSDWLCTAVLHTSISELVTCPSLITITAGQMEHVLPTRAVS